MWPLVTSDLDQSECFTRHCKADTQGFYLSVQSSNAIKNWPFQVNLYSPYPKFCATFWKPTSNINHWISTLLPVVWTSTLIFMMLQMSLYSDQVRNRGALCGMQMTPGSCTILPHHLHTLMQIQYDHQLIYHPEYSQLLPSVNYWLTESRFTS